MTVDTDGLLKFLFTPGKSYITDGERGGGKTHQAIAYAEMLIRRKDAPWGLVVLITNITFLLMTPEGPINKTPPGVHHVTTMKDMLLKIGELMKKHGRDVTILVILDEAQNFMLSDLNSEKTNTSLIKWFGTIRKFNCVVWLITPTIKNLVPRVRNFYNDDLPGYTSGMFRKDIPRARKYIEARGTKAQPRDYTTLQYGTNGKPWLLRIPPASWTRLPEDLKEGEYCYDHLSYADFALGEKFDLGKFNQALSNVPSHKTADAILDFFRNEETAAETESQAAEAAERIGRMLRIDRMRKMGISWSKISAIEDTPESTVKRWYRKHFNGQGAASNG